MDQEPLFPYHPAHSHGRLTRYRHRQRRQAMAIMAHQHPLAVALRREIRLHPDAPKYPGLPTSPGLRCGDCLWRRQIQPDFDRPSSPRCIVDNGSRISWGDGTLVRPWWPACVDFQVRPEGG